MKAWLRRLAARIAEDLEGDDDALFYTCCDEPAAPARTATETKGT